MFSKSIFRRFSSTASSKLVPQAPAPTPTSSRHLFNDAWVTQMVNRSVISVRGRDSTKILQNLATTNMNLFEKEGEDRACLYSSFLTVKGKLMYDAFIARPKLAAQTSEDTEYWIDIGEQDAEAFVKHVKRYSMRKNIKTEDVSHIIKSFSIQTLAGLDNTETEGHFFKTLQDKVPMFESEEFPGHFETDVCAFVDPRTRLNGVRMLCVEESFEPEEGVIIGTDQMQYDFARMMLGLPETSSEIGNQFPLNSHMHYLNGVHFDKGCYIGQELTQRTYFTGVVRKIILPFMVSSLDHKMSLDIDNFSPISFVDKGFDIDVKGSFILDQKGKKLGKVIAQQKNLGLAMIDITKLNKNGPNHEYMLQDYRAYLWQPTWLAMELAQEEEESEPEDEQTPAPSDEPVPEIKIEMGKLDKDGKIPK